MIITGNHLSYDIDKDSFINDVDIFDLGRYLKGLFPNKQRFLTEFLGYYRQALVMYDREDRLPSMDLLEYYYDISTPFSYAEAFAIKKEEFKALVFGTISIGEMISNLGNERISTQGKNVTHRFYNEDGTYTTKNYDVVYELHKIDCSKLGVNGHAYAVKCWCTSTNKEHWLWVEEQYAKNGPLEAIASTCRVYKSMIPHIKAIKRQGDIFLFEMDQEIKPEGEIVPLNATQYFNLLVAQS